MQNESLGGMEKLTSYLSLGSYFQAYPACHHVNLIMNDLYLECQGDLQIQQIFEVAIIDHNSDLCTTDATKYESILDTKGMNNLTRDIEKFTKCDRDSFYSKKDLKKKIEDKCLNNGNCSFTQEVTKFLKQADTECFAKQERLDLMVQFKCGNTKETLESRNKTAMVCSCLGVLGNLVFIVMMSYSITKLTKIRKLKYAEYTISSKNFSCEI